MSNGNGSSTPSGNGGLDEIREILRNILIVQDQASKGSHLEVLANISDELIRNKADRKKR
ncbi:MAG TPA: hypothetical protein VMH81_01645 [Bryobacteraceae bacterium]|nr:hypothetical protein [Bryobacteraceae bacterium]